MFLNLKFMDLGLLFHILVIALIYVFFLLGLTLIVDDLKEDKEEGRVYPLWVIKIFSFLVSLLLLMAYLYYTPYSITQIGLLFTYIFVLSLCYYLFLDPIFYYITFEDSTFIRKFILSLVLLILSLIFGSLFWFLWLYF